MVAVHHRTVDVNGLTVFYREAGPSDAPVLLLLHGYPTSSHMFRRLIPALAGPYRVIAPDHIGFGRSSAPSVTDFAYTFDALAEVTRGFLAGLGVHRYAIYVQDYGAPIGWRLALASPEAVLAVVSQNGNAYEEGFVPDFWEPIWAYGARRGPENEARLRPALGREAVEWQYTHGVPDPSLIDPDAWEHDLALLARPGVDRAQLALFGDYPSNRALYPAVHDWLRSSRVPVLAIWGRNDEIFAPAGAEAFRRDAPDAEIVLLDGGHFLLESHPDEVAASIIRFRPRVLGAPVSG
ncbi:MULTISPECIES: alpha/beta hydrolase [unclassified Streptomyces]|uniref:alpha/beta fold hydrolase n=1 Tax=unclassified Streptomyces TaxID=2593676 RepID=UPI002DD9AA91|nr:MULTISPECIES: alpha/beta hydrolase [unclassified Streptomyces]WSA91423.1 alpha/beta hydrolase [Streptomyces sp. NBC_01795]WSS15968.1 alpha/beta hydrolase [Streptomyces sp. NBC_01186]WSS44786.1 alpha/beta hydrolase [Streptomyces sp. NBC_01187]